MFKKLGFAAGLVFVGATAACAAFAPINQSSIVPQDIRIVAVSTAAVNCSTCLPHYSLYTLDTRVMNLQISTQAIYVDGTPVIGDCAKWVSATHVGDAGAPCGSGSGGGSQYTFTSSVTVVNSTVAITGTLGYLTSQSSVVFKGFMTAASLGVNTGNNQPNGGVEFNTPYVTADNFFYGGANGNGAYNNYIMGSNVSNYGQLGNVKNGSHGIWYLGYGGQSATGSTEVLSWNDSGNVGIGLGSALPIATFQVNGSALIQGNSVASGTGSLTGQDANGFSLYLSSGLNAPNGCATLQGGQVCGPTNTSVLTSTFTCPGGQFASAGSNAAVTCTTPAAGGSGGTTMQIFNGAALISSAPAVLELNFSTGAFGATIAGSTVTIQLSSVPASVINSGVIGAGFLPAQLAYRNTNQSWTSPQNFSSAAVTYGLNVGSLTVTGSTINLNGVPYTLPSNSGSANQVLQTAGATGVLSWANISTSAAIGSSQTVVNTYTNTNTTLGTCVGSTLTYVSAGNPLMVSFSGSVSVGAGIGSTLQTGFLIDGAFAPGETTAIGTGYSENLIVGAASVQSQAWQYLFAANPAAGSHTFCFTSFESGATGGVTNAATVASFVVAEYKGGSGSGSLSVSGASNGALLNNGGTIGVSPSVLVGSNTITFSTAPGSGLIQGGTLTITAAGWVYYIDSMSVTGSTSTGALFSNLITMSTFSIPANTWNNPGDEVQVECRWSNHGTPTGGQESICSNSIGPSCGSAGFAYWNVTTANQWLSTRGRAILATASGTNAGMRFITEGSSMANANGGGNSSSYGSTNAQGTWYGNNTTVSNNVFCAATNTSGGSINFVSMTVSKGYP